ncbi:LysE family translocator [Sutcliffiella horikoshii]|uniref:LysE family translocator n=1 Tax=Sutcliffiella horikoshii TaxID=79883 RepID=UPI001F38A2FF|nr:LysE family transporter [Sutcliffiella horikoshii]MCG1022914.1 amino acid transporter [Sutcliffiella horikoshii]
MELLWTILQFMVLGISLAAPIGPINLEMIKRGISSGFYSSWLVGLGGMSADILFLLSILLGMEPYLQIIWVEICMYGVGGTILLYLGITTIYGSFTRRMNLDLGQPIQRNSFIVGFSIAAFNPINFVFWFGIFGSSLHSLSEKSWIFGLVGCMSLILGIFLWNLNIAFTVHFARAFIKEKILKTVNFGAGVLLTFSAFPFLSKFLNLIL